jgi:hypothetical protein
MQSAALVSSQAQFRRPALCGKDLGNHMEVFHGFSPETPPIQNNPDANLYIPLLSELILFARS